MKFDLCTIGELMWLITLDINSFPIPGETTFVTATQRGIGNDAAIVSILASQMGLKTQLRSNSISQSDGLSLLKILTTNKVDCSLISLTERRTPSNYFLREPSGMRTWLPEINVHLPDVFEQIPINAQFVYIDLYEEAITTKLDILSKLIRGKYRVFVNLSASSIVNKLLMLHNFKELEIVQISSNKSLDEACGFAKYVFKKLTVEVVIITLGKTGSVLCTKKGVERWLVTKNDDSVLRTTGAGAAFSAGFIHALLKGHSYKEAHNIAGERSVQFCQSQTDPFEYARHI